MKVPVDLFSPSALGRVVGGASAPAASSAAQSKIAKLPGEAAGDDAKTEGERVTARISGAAFDESARQRVRAGIVDPYYAAMGKAMLAAWDPNRALPETTKELWLRSRAHNAALWARLMGETVARYGATGTPLTAGEPLPKGPSYTESVTGTTLETNKLEETYRDYLGGKFNAEKKALVLVTQHGGGRVGAELVRSSGDVVLDRAAVEDIRAAVEKLPEPDHSLGLPRRTLWSLRLLIVIVPPVPMLSFTFDEVMGTVKMDLPLDRKLLKRLQIEAVYDDDPRLARRSGG